MHKGYEKQILFTTFKRLYRMVDKAKLCKRNDQRKGKTIKNLLRVDRGINQLSQIEQKDLEDYKEGLHKRPIKSRTIEGYISVLKLVNEYLENYGEAPIIKAKLTIAKDLKKERTILTKVEVNQLYEACENNP